MCNVQQTNVHSTEENNGAEGAEEAKTVDIDDMIFGSIETVPSER
mgnify:CR=1 FL=1